MKRVFFLLLLLSAARASAANYCVSKDGNNGNSGVDDGNPAHTAANCKLTLASVINSTFMAPGNTITLYDGTWTERMYINCGTAPNPQTGTGTYSGYGAGTDTTGQVRIVAKNQRQAILIDPDNALTTPPNGGVHAAVIRLGTCSFYDINGLTIEGTGVDTTVNPNALMPLAVDNFGVHNTWEWNLIAHSTRAPVTCTVGCEKSGIMLNNTSYDLVTDHESWDIEH